MQLLGVTAAQNEKRPHSAAVPAISVTWNAQGVLPGLSGLSGFLFCSFFKG